jgi:hypothetical protein
MNEIDVTRSDVDQLYKLAFHSRSGLEKQADGGNPLYGALIGGGLGLINHAITPKDEDESEIGRLLRHVLGGAALGGLAGYGVDAFKSSGVGRTVNSVVSGDDSAGDSKPTQNLLDVLGLGNKPAPAADSSSASGAGGASAGGSSSGASGGSSGNGGPSSGGGSSPAPAKEYDPKKYPENGNAGEIFQWGLDNKVIPAAITGVSAEVAPAAAGAVLKADARRASQAVIDRATAASREPVSLEVTRDPTTVTFDPPPAHDIAGRNINPRSGGENPQQRTVRGRHGSTVTTTVTNTERFSDLLDASRQNLKGDRLVQHLVDRGLIDRDMVDGLQRLRSGNRADRRFARRVVRDYERAVEKARKIERSVDTVARRGTWGSKARIGTERTLGKVLASGFLRHSLAVIGVGYEFWTNNHMSPTGTEVENAFDKATRSFGGGNGL